MRELFQALESDSGMAFVVILHLAPKHKSMLSQMLAPTTRMPVADIVEATSVEPNHVYVITPGSDLEIRDGVLLPVPAEGPRRLPIDRFFRALAEDQRECAVGVVLSGTGADGTLGLQAIRGEGGLTFAQEPTSALHDGMPRSAIAARVVDFVLPVARIAAELVVRPHLLPPRDLFADQIGARDADDVLRQLLKLVQQRTGADFSLYKHTTLQRRLARRLAILKLPTLKEYLGYIERTPEEIELLHEDILVHVTSFFRDPETFEALKRAVFPELLAAKDSGTAIRVWVNGCSTGEEAYSLGMALVEFLEEVGSSNPIQIFGSDLSEWAIAHGRNGVYPESIVEQVGEHRLQRFFTKVEGGYRTSKALRDLCVFVKHDLTRDPPLSRIDLISCRNVLIYFEPGLQKRVVPLLHYSLSQPGYLVLGKSEALSGYGNLFALVDKESKIYARRPSATRPAVGFPLTPGSLGGPPLVPKAADPLRLGMELQRAADHILLSRFAPPGVLVNDDFEILQFRGRTGAYLEPAPGQASLALLKMAREGLASALQKALEQAKRENVSVRADSIAVLRDDHAEFVNVEVIPIRDFGSDVGRHFLVLFQEARESPEPKRRPKPEAARDARAEGRRVLDLRQELSAARNYLQALTEQHTAVTEELTAANEELQSSNEELQSTNEELETAKEELQSSNEELSTVNFELQSRNQEVDQINDDLLNLLASVDIPVVIVDLGRRVRRFTPPARQAFNLLPSDVGRPIGEIRPNIEAADFDDWIARAIETAGTYEREVADREGRWQRLHVRPYLTSGKRIDGAVISMVDIDTLKRTGEAAAAARDRATVIIETVPLPLLVVNETLAVESVNRSFRELFQTGSGADLGQHLQDLLGGPWRSKDLRILLEEAVSRGASFEDVQIEHELAHAGRRTFTLSGRAIPWEQGRRSLLLVIQDVTANRIREDERVRQRAERAQRFLNEVSRVLLAESPEFPVSLPRVAALLLPTLGDWCLLTLLSDQSRIAHVEASHVDPQRQRQTRELQWTLAAGQDAAAGILEVVRSGESHHAPRQNAEELAAWFGLEQPDVVQDLGVASSLCVPLHGRRNEVLGTLSMVRALPGQEFSPELIALAEAVGQRVGLAVENARLFQAARDAVSIRDDFIGIASHELRTPLTALQLVLQRLDARVESKSPVQQHKLAVDVERALEQSNRLARLVDSLLVVSRVNAGRLDLSLEEFDLAELVRDVVAQLGPEAEKAGCEVTVAAPDTVRGRWDPLRLEQVVTNLLTNAFRHAPGRQVLLDVEADDVEARLVVRDTGPGIALERQRRIFERFEAAGEHATAGLGLGLFITQQIAQAHGGSVAVQSRPGEGASFHVRLPRKPPEP